jgi:cold-inducible RNA-binding protein
MTTRPTIREEAMRIFVGSLALTTTEAELRQLFTYYGHVERVQVLTDRETGRSRGFGFVEMPDATAAQAAVEGLNGRSLEGRFLTVNEARPREDGDGWRRPRW